MSTISVYFKIPVTLIRKTLNWSDISMTMVYRLTSSSMMRS